MIVDKDNPMESLRWFTKKAADEIINDYSQLSEKNTAYFFNEEKTTIDRLSEIRSIGNNDQFHLVCVSEGLVAVHIVDFMNWNNIPFDAEKYLSRKA